MEVELLDDSVNFVVVRTPGRNFPGMVVQGDKLRRLLCMAESLRRQLEVSADEDIRDDADELREELEAMVLHYQRVLLAHGEELPWPRLPEPGDAPQ